MPKKRIKYPICDPTNGYVGTPKVGEVHWHHDYGWETWDGEKWVDSRDFKSNTETN